MKAKFKTCFLGEFRFIGGVAGASLVLLMGRGIQAQNLFVSINGPGNGAICECTPEGTQSSFASGLKGHEALAFNSAGNLFVAKQQNGVITEFAPDGTQSNFVSGLSFPAGLAFNTNITATAQRFYRVVLGP